MLEGVDGVAWSGLTHAHGPAVDVPAQLRAVAGADRAAAEQALYDLYGSLWNEGSVYPATAAAVPFLVELGTASGLDTSLRVDVLVLLARIGAAAGGGADDRRAAGAGLEHGRDSLESLLDSEAAELRAAAAGLAGVFPTPSRRWVRRLRELRDADGDALLRAHFAVAAALADGRQPDRADVERAAAADPYVARWRGNRFEGLLGLRLSKRAAVDLSLLLTELVLERT